MSKPQTPTSGISPRLFSLRASFEWSRDREIKHERGSQKVRPRIRSEAPRSSPGYIRPVRRDGDIGTPRAAVKSSLNWVGPRRPRVPPQGGAVLLEPALLVVRSDFATNQRYVRCRPCIVPRESFIRPGACRPQLAARRAQTKKVFIGRVRLLK